MVNVYSKCPVCGADVVQGYDLIERVCDICGKNFVSNSFCKNGHYICNKCASDGYFKEINEITEKITIKDPIAIADMLMSLKESNLVGCKHTIITYASVLTAFKNCGGPVRDFEKMKKDVAESTVICPTAMCKLGGFCVIPLSMGIAMRTALSENMPEDLRTDLSNKLTGDSMAHIGNQNNTGNKNCCVRNTYLTILYASKFISNNLWVSMPLPKKIVCKFSMGNPRCNKEECTLYHGMNADKSTNFLK